MYNAEKYIRTCLDSILDSDLPKDCYEVIIINDGSKDNGPEIAQEYCKKNSNFRYLTQENQGQSVARNYGIRKAQGEYVWCVDSDDKVDSRNITDVYKDLEANPVLDIFAFVLKQETEQNEFVRKECLQPAVRHNKLMSGKDAIIEGYNPSSVCALWIKKELIIANELFFKEGITHQDVELSYRLFTYADKVIFTHHIPYIYILHPNSTSRSINSEKKIKYLSDDIIVYQSFMRLAMIKQTDEQLSSIIKQRANDILFGLVFSLFQNRREWRSLGINYSVIEEMKKNHLYPLKGIKGSWKKRLFVKLLNIESLIV